MTSPDTFGWDSVFAVRLGIFNRLIPASDGRELALGFDFFGSGKPDTKIGWTFGPWQAVSVYGAVIELSAPLVRLTLALQDANPISIDANCQVSINLALSAESPRPVNWATVKINAVEPDEAHDAMVQYGLQCWLGTSDAQMIFDKIFKPLQIDMQATGPTQWALPRCSRLAGATLALPPPTPDADTSCGVGFLARTLSDDTTGNRLALSPYAIGATADAAYIVSGGLLLSGIIAPALARAFGTADDTAQTDYALSDDTLLTNTIPLTYAFACDDGRSYTGSIAPHDFKVQLGDGVLTLTFEAIQFDVDLAGLKLQTIKIHMVERLKVALLPSPTDASSAVLMLVRDGDPVVLRDSDDTLLAIGGEAVIAFASALVAGLLNKFLPGAMEARFAWSPIAARLFTGVTDLLAQGLLRAIAEIPDIMKSIELDQLGELPTLEQMIALAVASYDLPVPLKFRVAGARLDPGLVVDLTYEPSISP